MTRASLRDIDMKAVALGVVTGFGLAFLWISLVAFLLHGASSSPEDFQARAFAPSTMILTTLLGLSFTALGGWVAARRVGEHVVLQGAAVGVGVLALFVLMALIPVPEPPSETDLLPWISVASWLLTVPAAMAGAALERARRRRAARAALGGPDGDPGGDPGGST